LFYWFYTKVH